MPFHGSTKSKALRVEVGKTGLEVPKRPAAPEFGGTLRL